MEKPKVLVGTASWTDRSLLESGWYPPEAKTPAARLAYYASQFPLVEVDATYYGMPSERNSIHWSTRTPDGFTFTVKAFSLLTHHPTKVTALPKDLRSQVSPNQATVYLRDLPGDMVDEIWNRYLAALQPLVDSGKLGGILLQFPPWFHYRGAAFDYLAECRTRCSELPLCVEFRHHSWLAEKNRVHTFNFLAEHDLSYVCVDMPQGYSSSIPPILTTTNDLAVVRLHGHSQQWESKDIRERFNYFYSPKEIAAWAENIRLLSSQATATYVLFNNCCGHNSQTNAQQLIDLLANEN